ncbi:hypothetical protein ACFU44_31370 [Nocardia rhizosphaerihabitans]|uniref:hypothetical protein n=1 Tax=Nocardia rhizosphaerihabitans TaxID=1691570 RepID=UPI003672BE96
MRMPWRQGDVLDLASIGSRVDSLTDLSTIDGGPGARLTAVRTQAQAFRREFIETGTPDSVTTCDLVTLPYPTRFGLFRASRAIAPFLAITNRLLVIRWHESDGTPRVLLFEPSDVELGRYTPYFDKLAGRTPDVVSKRMVTEHATVLTHLARRRLPDVRPSAHPGPAPLDRHDSTPARSR